MDMVDYSTLESLSPTNTRKGSGKEGIVGALFGTMNVNPSG
jgi:hypothetical protein